jgi:sterol desaturase/sphingolipid hydroxylase (fatty acid hydroxylase superfamily)
LTTPAAGSTGLVGEIVRRGISVAVVVAPMIAACWWVSTHHPLGGFSFAIYVAVAGLLVLCEHWLPFDRRWGSAMRGNRTDVLYVIVATAMDKATFVVCMTAIAAVGRGLAHRFQMQLWPTTWSLGWQIMAALVIADVATYVRHRLAHGSSLLWRFHRVHHSMTELYWIRSAYTHPLEQLMILTAIMLPIAFLGAGDQVVAAVAFLFGLSGLLQHANVDARSSVLNRVFATPEVHRAHHRADAGNRTNFSAFFVLMDILFGTYDPPDASEKRIRVGLEDEPAFPRDFLSHLTIPFGREPVGRSQSGVATASIQGEP